MRFCPKCEVKLRRGIDLLSCPKCGYSEAPGAQKRAAAAPDSAALQGTAKTDDRRNDGLNVFDDDSEEAGTRPTINIECEKCDNNEAVWWMLQTRSADEPTTQFYRCTKCQYTWRDYS